MIGVIAIAFGTINIVGGFMVTDRMLGMFVGKGRPARAEGAAEVIAARRPRGRDRARGAQSLYVVSFSLFIIGIGRGPIQRPRSRAT